MYRVALSGERDFEGWRKAARALALAGVPTDQVTWDIDDGDDLFAGKTADDRLPDPPEGAQLSVPRQFLALAEAAVRHSDRHRFAMLYELLLRLRSEPRLLTDPSDPLVRRIGEMALEPRLEELRQRNDRDAALAELIVEAKHCTRCPLYKDATQTVFGEGPASARLMLMGEQPGEQEDQAGRPFVGPAGRMLDKALDRAGIDRSETYVTNAVKHFRFDRRGKRRLHKTPDASHIEACSWWLAQERALVRPPVTVALGASAARALLGRQVTIGRTRGQALKLDDGLTGWVTVHPSYLLRIDDEKRADDEFGRFVADLKGAYACAAELV